MNREHWLHGWARQGWLVFIGTGMYCAGCGKLQGTVCIVADESPQLPLPDWPFNEDGCPVCVKAPPVDRLTERLKALRKGP